MPDARMRMTNLERRIVDYWDERAPGYSLATRLSMRSERSTLESMGRMVNLNRRMRVADMGTSAGLVALWLSEIGHDVLGIDMSERMIGFARKNARELGLSAKFEIMDAQNPDLENSSFDLIVAKSVVWCLEDPVGAYSRWIDLLKPGGCLLIIDGNYYLDLFDEDYRKRKQYLDLKNGVDNNLHAKTNIGRVDLNIIRKIAMELPLTRERRPTWDVSTLLGLGMMDIRIRSLDPVPYSVLTENGLMRLPSTFIVCAQKPYGDISPLEAENMRLPVDDSAVKEIGERIRASGTPQLDILKALSDAKRMAIINALKSGRMSVNQLAVVTDSSPSLVSHNLKTLRDAGVVTSSREGKEMKYSLTNLFVVDELLYMCDILHTMRGS